MAESLAIRVARPPVILLGMHRSGTSLIARLLDELGLFQGHELQDDHESVFFLEMNDLLMKRIGAAWDHPAVVRQFLQNDEALALTARCLAVDLSGRPVRQFLGLKRAMRLRGLERLDQPWGWKDPRTVFTLPAWLRLFPDARLVYIVRNGVDVAASLRVREVRELNRRVEAFEAKRNQLNKHSMLERASFKGSARCLTLEGGLSLWEEYVEEAERQLASVGNERMVVNYEAFLSDPTAELPPLAAFCGVSDDPQRVLAAASTVRPERSKAYERDPELADFYRQARQSAWMQRYGYA